MELCEPIKRTSSLRRTLIAVCVGEVANKIGIAMGVEYRRCLFEKTDLAIIADGRDDNLVNLECMEGDISFLDTDSTPEPFEDVLPSSPDPADKEHLPGSSDGGDHLDDNHAGADCLCLCRLSLPLRAVCVSTLGTVWEKKRGLSRYIDGTGATVTVGRDCKTVGKLVSSSRPVDEFSNCRHLPSRPVTNL